MKLKRLRFIQNLIAEGNISIAEEELNALEQIDGEGHLADAVRKCMVHNPDNACLLIDDFLRENNRPVHQSEIEMSGMQTEAKLLETRFSVLQGRKAEISRQINQFRIRHNHELGMIMSELLKLRWEKAMQDFDDEKADEEEAQQAQQDYKRHQQSREHFHEKSKIPRLKKEEKERIKRLFREASKICHPDMVAEETQEQAEKIFHELNNAYFYNDIGRIEEIYKMLKSGEIDFGSRDIALSEKQRLSNYLSKLRTDIYALQAEISDMENAPVWISLKRIDDWDEYFADLKEKFSEEIHLLKTELAYEQ